MYLESVVHMGQFLEICLYLKPAVTVEDIRYLEPAVTCSWRNLLELAAVTVQDFYVSGTSGNR